MNSTTNIPELIPPVNRGYYTVNDIQNLEDHTEYGKLAKFWAQDVWDAWSKYHDLIRKELTKLYENRRID